MILLNINKTHKIIAAASNKIKIIYNFLTLFIFLNRFSNSLSKQKH